MEKLFNTKAAKLCTPKIRKCQNEDDFSTLNSAFLYIWIKLLVK